MIWKRYFFKELAKFFFLFIGSLYFLYVLIDYSAHTKLFHNHEEILFTDIFLYYAFQFTKRADILIPVALMISSIKVLTTLNLRNEVVAMSVGGVPLKKLMRPFLFAGAICATLLYLNFEYLQPYALTHLEVFEKTYFKSPTVDEKQVHSLILADNTLLIYRSFEQNEQAFIDAYWLKEETDDIYHIQTLYPYTEIPSGYLVDHLVRAPSGELLRQETFQEHLFPEMEFEKKALFNVIHPLRWQSLTQLFRNLGWRKIQFGMGQMHDREAEAATFFFYKLMIPLVCFFAVIAPAPFCLRFGRHLPIFMIYALSLFGIVTFFTLVNASVILGENQVVSPFWAMITVPGLFFITFGWRYAKL